MTAAPSLFRTAVLWITSAAAGCAGPALAQDLAVSAVRFWSLGDVTRVAIETTGEFQQRYDRLSNPDRIFFDFPGAENRVSRKSLFVIPVGDSILRQIRVAEPKTGNTRVVLDLEGQGVHFTASYLSNPDRLIVELRSGSSQPAAPSTGLERAPVASEYRVVPKRFIPPPSATPVPTLITPPPQQRPQRVPAGETLPPILAREVTAMSTIPPPIPAATRAPVVPSRVPLANARGSEASILSRDREGAVVKHNVGLDTRQSEPTASVSGVPAPAKRAVSGASTLTRALGLKVGRVVLDAGHGGHDAGTIGRTGLMEKELVLDVSKRLGALIEKGLGSQVIYTRTDDSFVPLEARTAMANRLKADLFLSIHANFSPLRSVSGSETYYLSFTTSRTALDVAARENASSERGVFELRELVQKIALKDKVDESREFAVKVQAAMQSVNPRAARAQDRGIKKAPFVVLIGASMPSILTEIGFVSNAREEGLLKRSEHRQKIAEALYKGVSQYAQALSHFDLARRDDVEE